MNTVTETTLTKETAGVGDIFRNRETKEFYMLVSCGPDRCVLINLKNGYRFCEPMDDDKAMLNISSSFTYYSSDSTITISK